MSVCASVAHLRLLRHRHAEHLGDHPERQREGEVGDHVELAAPGHGGVEHLVDHRLHPRRQLLDRPRREHLLHQAAEPGVVGRVEVEDAPGAPLGAVRPGSGARISSRGLAPDHGSVLDAQGGIAEQPDGVVVAEQRPEPERRPLHRVGRAELGVLAVRILREARLEGVEGFRLTGHISHSGHRPDKPLAGRT